MLDKIIMAHADNTIKIDCFLLKVVQKRFWHTLKVSTKFMYIIHNDCSQCMRAYRQLKQWISFSERTLQYKRMELYSNHQQDVAGKRKTL